MSLLTCSRPPLSLNGPVMTMKQCLSVGQENEHNRRAGICVTIPAIFFVD